MVEREDGDPGRDERNDEIFVERVVFAENGQVQEHDWQELARFGQDEGDVVDVREGGVTERGGQRGGDGYQDQGKEDGAGGKDGGSTAASRGGGEEVYVAGQGGKGGLDRVEEDGVGELFRRGWGSVWGCRYAFLEQGPRETGQRGVSSCGE